MSEQNEKKCPEFPYFGASYPDATCIDGYLWDLDIYNDGQLYGGEDHPCPFCNTEMFIEQKMEEEGVTRDMILSKIEKLRERYGK